MKDIDVKKRRPIDVVRGIGKQEFRQYLEGVGRPVVIKGAIDSWPAANKWTLDFFEERFHQHSIRVQSDIINYENNTTMETTLGAYIQWIKEGNLSALIPQSKIEGPWPAKHSSYFSSSLGKLGEPGRALFDDFSTEFDFIDDLQNRLPPPLNHLVFHLPYANLFIGPRGTFTYPHVDFWSTHTYIIQFLGKKHAILMSPEDCELISDADGKLVDPWNPDSQRFPRFQEATYHTGIIEPGDVLFFPGNWYHAVESVEASISLSWNFFTAENIVAYLSGLIASPIQIAFGLTHHPEIKEKYINLYNQLVSNP